MVRPATYGRAGCCPLPNSPIPGDSRGGVDDTGDSGRSWLAAVRGDARRSGGIRRPGTAVTARRSCPAGSDSSSWAHSGVRARRIFAVALMLLVPAGCVVPTPDEGTYAEKAQKSLEAAASQTATVDLVISQVLAQRAFRSFADQTVSETEDSLSSVADQFGSMQPPPSPGADAVRDRTTTLLSRASDVVAAARIALRR